MRSVFHRLAWLAGFSLGLVAIVLLLRTLLQHQEDRQATDDEATAGDMGTDTGDLDIQRPEASP